MIVSDHVSKYMHVLILSLRSAQTYKWIYTDHLNISVLMVIPNELFGSVLYSSVHDCIWSCLPKHRHVLKLSLRSAQSCTWKYSDHLNICALMVIAYLLFVSVLNSSVHDYIWLCLPKHRHVLILSLKLAQTCIWKYLDHLSINVLSVLCN